MWMDDARHILFYILYNEIFIFLVQHYFNIYGAVNHGNNGQAVRWHPLLARGSLPVMNGLRIM